MLSTRRACLLLHGFTGGPFEVLPLSETLSRAGWDCRVPVLPGHDGPVQALADVRCAEWLEAAAKEAEDLVRTYGSFDLVGFSMGGMLAVYLAARYPVRRLALLSAAAIYLSPIRFMNEWLRQRRNGERTASRKIRQTPLKATMEFMKLVRSVRPDLSKISAPSLILQGLKDPVVHPYSARYISERLQGKHQIRYFPESKHLLCLDTEARQVMEAVQAFFSQV